MGVLLVAVAGWLTRLEDWRSYSPVGGGGHGEGTAHGHAEKPSGLTRWLTTVDHKDIGILYLVYSVVTLVGGGLAALLMRFELVTPKMDFLNTVGGILGGIGGATLYNGLLTTHGITMLFLFAAPLAFAFGNYVIPLLVDAEDMAFPRVNAIAFWILPFATLLIWAGYFLKPLGIGVIPAPTSWTMYAPLTGKAAAGGQLFMPNPGVDLLLLGLHLSGISTTMGGINFIATIVAERNVPWTDVDIFSWTVLTTGGIILFAFPLLGAALIMLLLDRNFGTTFFTVEGGGTILWQHLFWFFGHPEVYILVLPPMGILSMLIPKFSGRKLFGFKFVVYSTLAIGVLSFGVWAHHMFTTGMDPRLRASFMAVSLAIAIPSAVKTFNWITTMWNGKIRLTAPMLFSIGALQNFILGGVTGVFLASIPFDLLMHDTYYVVGHFHFMVFGMIGFALFAATYYYFPMITGRLYNKKLAQWHFWLSIIGANITFIAMMILGYGGMPRRYATFDLSMVAGNHQALQSFFVSAHGIATLGAVIMAVGQIIWLWNVVQSFRSGKRVEDGDPWNLKTTGQFTREWAWFEQKLQTKLPDGGEEEEEADAAQSAD
ncbi:cytochrome-c oxidase [Salarchaeum sp. JOR-1]|nr:cytochrome-c oxidase [Salarchaeum sp. JOR-1]